MFRLLKELTVLNPDESTNISRLTALTAKRSGSTAANSNRRCGFAATRDERPPALHPVRLRLIRAAKPRWA